MEAAKVSLQEKKRIKQLCKGKKMHETLKEGSEVLEAAGANPEQMVIFQEFRASC